MENSPGIQKTGELFEVVFNTVEYFLDTHLVGRNFPRKISFRQGQGFLGPTSNFCSIRGWKKKKNVPRHRLRPRNHPRHQRPSFLRQLSSPTKKKKHEHTHKSTHAQTQTRQQNQSEETKKKCRHFLAHGVHGGSGSVGGGVGSGSEGESGRGVGWW